MRRLAHDSRTVPFAADSGYGSREFPCHCQQLSSALGIEQHRDHGHRQAEGAGGSEPASGYRCAEYFRAGGDLKAIAPVHDSAHAGIARQLGPVARAPVK